VFRRFDVKPVLFIPPSERYNEQQVAWAREMDVLLFGITPDGGSYRDWIPEGEDGFVPSREILDDILTHEKRDPDGLNGAILLMHLGAHRVDKMYRLLEELVTRLRQRSYTFVRIDEMLRGAR
jgi:peptidoglycan/xylan/chitin deacetylase (PgdA/CDA1 family)